METKMKKSFLTFISFVLFSLSLNAQVSNKFEPIDIFDLEYVSDPQISPQGDRVLFQRNFKDIMTDKNLSNLWIVNFDGSGMRPITTGNSSSFSPRWSNSGTMFTYKSNEEGRVQLYLYNLENHSIQKLTNIQSSIGNVEWSANDQYLLFNSFVEETSGNIIKMPKKPNPGITKISIPINIIPTKNINISQFSARPLRQYGVRYKIPAIIAAIIGNPTPGV